MPVGNVLVGNTGCDIEHDDTTLTVDVVSITKTSKLLLSCGIPDIELDVAQVLQCFVSWMLPIFGQEETYCAKSQRMNLDTKSSNVLLFELTSQVTLDEGGLPKC